MHIQISAAMRRDIDETVRDKLSQSSVINVFVTAEEIRRRHVEDNVAREDIAALVTRLAAQRGCALELDDEFAGVEDTSAARSLIVLPEGGRGGDAADHDRRQ